MITALDMARLREITDGDAALERQLFALFMETADRLIALLAMQLPDTTGKWQQTVHQLKGACANMHVAVMWQLCQELEKLHGESERSDKLEELKKAYAVLRSELAGVVTQPQ